MGALIANGQVKVLTCSTPHTVSIDNKCSQHIQVSGDYWGPYKPYSPLKLKTHKIASNYGSISSKWVNQSAILFNTFPSTNKHQVLPVFTCFNGIHGQ